MMHYTMFGSLGEKRKEKKRKHRKEKKRKEIFFLDLVWEFMREKKRKESYYVWKL